MTADEQNAASAGARAPQTQLLAAAVLLAVAVAGGAAGVVLDRTLLMPRGRPGRPPMGEMSRRGGPPSAESRKRFSDRIAQELGLTPDQQVRVDSIMTRQFEGMRHASESVRPTIDSLVRSAQASMDSVLTPAQREKVKAMRQRGRPFGGGRSP
jgi:Spy/CpxP family protein refolding chaperone